MKTSNTVLPWYKHKWLWFLLAGPLVVVAASVVTIYYAVTTKDSLIVDDYYKEGTTINEVIVKDETASKLGITAQLVMGEDKKIRVFLKQTTGEPVYDHLALFFQHAVDQKQDKHFNLYPEGAPGSYVSSPIDLKVGKWYMDITDPKKTWQLSGEIQTNKEFQVNLKAK
ncbi:FixH family protein [Leeia sp. TBRC 13508]|uniref:FixH family protein n=1 Tax=Leeia speluncae TaxID=2884804 RepID=A0ABS8D938_9NEIS|nr:FixH family protein [Leeia speluncae]MCB6184733.1 FixH family protein [Leeia speluncae]